MIWEGGGEKEESPFFILAEGRKKKKRGLEGIPFPNFDCQTKEGEEEEREDRGVCLHSTFQDGLKKRKKKGGLHL